MPISQSNNKILSIDDMPGFEAGWPVYNCGEVWSAREAILNGAKFDELKFTSIWKSNGTKNVMCNNCQITFAGKEYLFTGD